MTFFQILDSLLLQPLQLLFEVVYVNANRVIGNPGLSIIVLSLVMNFLVLPLYMRADALQEEERDMEARLHRGVTHIKKTFRGDEKMMILQTYYRQNHYKPTYVLRSAVSLFLEIPFFIAAYRFLSGLELIKGVSFGPIADLGAADGLIAIAGVHINLLPIIMTAVNLVSCIIFTKGATPKTKIQLYVMAVFFLFFLYTSPAGLVFYWTLNNIFSLIKTIFYKLKHPGRVLKILAAVAGAALLALGLVRYSFSERPVVKAALLLLGAALMLPPDRGADPHEEARRRQARHQAERKDLLWLRRVPGAVHRRVYPGVRHLVVRAGIRERADVLQPDLVRHQQPVPRHRHLCHLVRHLLLVGQPEGQGRL